MPEHDADPDETSDEGFVEPDEPDESDVDLAAPTGTPEYERAQEEVMIQGAADAESD